MKAPGASWTETGDFLIDRNAIVLQIAKGQLCPECTRRAPESHRVFCPECRAEYVRGIHRMRGAA
jgi:hypothetical protein